MCLLNSPVQWLGLTYKYTKNVWTQLLEFSINCLLKCLLPLIKTPLCAHCLSESKLDCEYILLKKNTCLCCVAQPGTEVLVIAVSSTVITDLPVGASSVGALLKNVDVVDQQMSFTPLFPI